MGTEEISAAEAALEAARLGLIGTIAVGLIAALTTLIGTMVAPFLIRRSEVKVARDNRRRDELIEIIPDVIVKGIRGTNPNATGDQLADSLSAHAKLGVLLSPGEWQIAAIAREALLVGEGGADRKELIQRAGKASWILPAWARGEMTAAEAAAMFERDTGVKVTRPTPPTP